MFYNPSIIENDNITKELHELRLFKQQMNGFLGKTSYLSKSFTHDLFITNISPIEGDWNSVDFDCLPNDSEIIIQYAYVPKNEVVAYKLADGHEYHNDIVGLIEILNDIRTEKVSCEVPLYKTTDELLKTYISKRKEREKKFKRKLKQSMTLKFRFLLRVENLLEWITSTVDEIHSQLDISIKREHEKNKKRSSFYERNARNQETIQYLKGLK